MGRSELCRPGRHAHVGTRPTSQLILTTWQSDGCPRLNPVDSSARDTRFAVIEQTLLPSSSTSVERSPSRSATIQPEPFPYDLASLECPKWKAIPAAIKGQSDASTCEIGDEPPANRLVPVSGDASLRSTVSEASCIWNARMSGDGLIWSDLICQQRLTLSAPILLLSSAWREAMCRLAVRVFSQKKCQQ